MTMMMMMMMMGKEAALGCGLEGEDGRIRGILCIFVTTRPRVRPSTALHPSVLNAGMGKVMPPAGWGQPSVRERVDLSLEMRTGQSPGLRCRLEVQASGSESLCSHLR